MSHGPSEGAEPPPESPGRAPSAGEHAVREAVGRDPRAAVRAFGCGLAMGTADAVPGVSGGTIALILGIYDRFIGSLAALVAVLRHPGDGATWRAARRG